LRNWYFLILIFFAGSCNSFLNNRDERVLARVFDEMLYESEVVGLVPVGASAADSLAITRNYIDNWVQQQLLIHQATRNLSEKQMDFTQQLENYKNSLIIYAYENALISQSLDTVVSEDELQNYYDQNQQNFLLKENIVQFQYVKLPLKTPNIAQFRKLLNTGTEESQTRLSELCEKQAVDYFLDDRNWVLFNDLLRQIPVKTYNQEEFLKNHREFESQDSVFIYLVRFRDFKIKETISPFSYEKSRIRDIIVNKRKIDLLHKMREDLYNRALKSNDVEIF
jgi:hypothetical protein